MMAEQSAARGNERAGIRVQENIKALRQAITEEAREEAQRILDDTQTQAQAIYQQAEAQVNTKRETLLARAREASEKLHDQTVALAQIEAQTLKLQRREQILSRVFAQARQQIASAPQWPDYAQIARRLVRDAVAHLGTDNALVRADVETQKVLSPEVLADLASELGVYLRAGKALTDGTGVVLETPDGHRRYDNRLETRLARMKGTLRTPVYRLLTGETA